jgi:acetyltransferase
MDLEKLFKPESMAVVGISKNNPLSPGRVIFIKNVFEMNVYTYGIHPDGGEVEGVQLYKSIEDLPKIPDLLVIAIPAKATLEYVEQCVEYGIPACIIISGGFAEIGGEGKKRQERLVEIATENDLAVLGPNCIGVYTPPLLDTIFMPTERITRPPKGTVALISQSGGVLVDQFFHKFNQINIGVSTAVSIGNRAVVDETMLLEYFSKHDPDTKNLAFYLEGFKKSRSREFLKHAKESEDMVITYFGGLSEKGKKATESHTASISGNAKILSAALKQYLVVQPTTELELLTDLKLLEIVSHKKKPFDSTSIKEGNVAIVSLSGGHGVICADLLPHYDLNAVELTAEEQEDMKAMVNKTARSIATFSNPIDLTGSAKDEDVENLIQYLSGLDRIECIIVLILPYTPSVTFQIGRRIANRVMHERKPVVCFMPYIEKYGSIIEGLELSNVPVFHSIEEAVQAVSALKKRARILRIKKGDYPSFD